MLYSKPQKTGGTLIRLAVATLREQKVNLPIQQTVWIAVSGGADSTALAHLIVHYGRRIVDRSQIRILHIHHGWRPQEADLDLKFVKALARKWRVPFRAVTLDPKHLKKGQSWEDSARKERKKIFDELIQNGDRVITAHQADDLAETILWRLATGTNATQGKGIYVDLNGQIRPLLRARKGQLLDYLKEEKQKWREDLTNQDPRFMRARMRQTVMPALEEIFPRVVQNLVNQALSEQKQDTSEKGMSVLSALSSVRLQPVHHEWIREQIRAGGQIDLPHGWVLKCDHPRQNSGARWILEKKP